MNLLAHINILTDFAIITMATVIKLDVAYGKTWNAQWRLTTEYSLHLIQVEEEPSTMEKLSKRDDDIFYKI